MLSYTIIIVIQLTAQCSCSRPYTANTECFISHFNHNCHCFLPMGADLTTRHASNVSETLGHEAFCHPGEGDVKDDLELGVDIYFPVRLLTEVERKRWRYEAGFRDDESFSVRKVWCKGFYDKSKTQAPLKATKFRASPFGYQVSVSLRQREDARMITGMDDTWQPYTSEYSIYGTRFLLWQRCITKLQTDGSVLMTCYACKLDNAQVWLMYMSSNYEAIRERRPDVLSSTYVAMEVVTHCFIHSSHSVVAVVGILSFVCTEGAILFHIFYNARKKEQRRDANLARNMVISSLPAERICNRDLRNSAEMEKMFQRSHSLYVPRKSLFLHDF